MENEVRKGKTGMKYKSFSWKVSDSEWEKGSLLWVGGIQCPFPGEVDTFGLFK